ncbi:hypothetical protein M9H77_27826 [Catharanthus roseus]|uniref:Uncharacterized protein n=1 Tax=Catharanthus roseus TaxID=4058 RepID=A0ACC0AHW9_CATRO|nr:hypothetical protein M9H77_27826 [Catharanthus roseus]
MKEIPAHVHLGPQVSDVLMRQHKHMSGLIWSGDHKTCITDLQCRRFAHNLFKAYSTAPGYTLLDMSGNLIHVRYIILLEDFDSIDTYNWGSYGCTTDRGSPCVTLDLGLVAYSCIASSVRSTCGTRPSCSIWYYVVHII